MTAVLRRWRAWRRMKATFANAYPFCPHVAVADGSHWAGFCNARIPLWRWVLFGGCGRHDAT